MAFCVECGFKLLKMFKHCPKCGYNLNSVVENDSEQEKSEKEVVQVVPKKTTKKVKEPVPESSSENEEEDPAKLYKTQRTKNNPHYKTVTLVKKILSDKQRVHMKNLSEKMKAKHALIKKLSKEEQDKQLGYETKPMKPKVEKPTKKIEQKVEELELSEPEPEPEPLPLPTIPEVPHQPPKVNIYSSIFAPRTKY